MPAAVLHAGDRYLGRAVRAEEHGAVGDAVLLGADELLAIEHEDVGVAGVVGEQRGHGPLPHLADAERAGGDGVGEERVGQLRLVAGEEWKDGQVVVRLGRADADVEHAGPPCENVGGKVGGGSDSGSSPCVSSRGRAP